MSQLTNYIQKELEKGFSKDLVTKKLLQAGYSQQEISESFQSLKSAEPLLRRKSIEMPHMEFHIKRSRWVFGTLAIVLVACFGYLIYLYEGELLPSDELGTSLCTEFEGNEKDICYLRLSANGEERCFEIENLAIKTACEQKIWEQDDCTYPFFLGEDYDACLFQKAIETKDTKYCTMQEEHSDCLYELAIATEDSSLCGGDGSCLFNYAIENKDITACEFLAGMFRYQCYDTYAEKTGDLSACDKGSELCGYPYNGKEEDKKTFIEEMISSLSTEVTEEGSVSEKDKKLLFAAFHTRDSLFCYYIMDFDKKEQCIGELQ